MIRYVMFYIMDIYLKFTTFVKKQPHQGVELWSPGLLDQCSNHWANEAHMPAAKKKVQVVLKK